ncbi:MAG: hypothetical protein R3C68_11800 [Myxococcota bacterium]
MSAQHRGAGHKMGANAAAESETTGLEESRRQQIHQRLLSYYETFTQKVRRQDT